MLRDDVVVPRRRRSPDELREAPLGTLSVEEQRDREAALTLDRLLQPVAEKLAAPHECGLHDCRDRLSKADLAHDADVSEDAISYALNGQVWPNLQLLLALVGSIGYQALGYRRADG